MDLPAASRLWVSLRFALAGLAVAAFFLPGSLRSSLADDDALQTIREDVRDAPPAASSSVNQRHPSSGGNGACADSDAATSLLGLVILPPIFGPIAMLDDDYSKPSNFPYALYGEPSLIHFDAGPDLRLWSARLDAEYANDFGGLDSWRGHLLLETTSRFGLEASAGELQQRLAGGGRDALALGDANLVFRFAQSDWAEFRTGLGANWLADGQEGNCGFNFIYAADFFPRKPWVISSVIDVGMLGGAGLFRFRLTGGAVFHGVEAYTGYEYLDIGRTDSNSLVAGLRFWF